MEPNKMQPLTHGSILVVGTKASNMPEELRNHPRIIMWDSQDERWANKELPVNVRAVFTTRFIGHSEFVTIMKEARKKGITIFPCEGTGQIIKMAKELLDVEGLKTAKAAEVVEAQEVMTAVSAKGKLIPLIAYIDPDKSQTENAKILFEKAQELKIDTTLHSVTNLVYRKTTAMNKPLTSMVEKPKEAIRTATSPTLDASVEILDNMVQKLTDMRQEVVDLRDFLVAVTEENANLKKRIVKFKKMLDGAEDE